MNYAKTAILMAAMMALFGVIGLMVGGQIGMLLALAFGAATNLFAYWNSDRMALAAHNAVEVGPNDAPELYGMVQDLAAKAGLPMPRVYLMDDPQPNAFATGRNPQNAAVAATTGIMNLLSYEELAGVMAHELAHIKNRDTLIMTITATIAGAISAVVNFGFMFRGRDDRPNFIVQILIMLLAPLAAGIVQMAISRTREYSADKLGGEICGNPLWLASALQRITAGVAHTPSENAERHPATAHLFIVNPLSGQGMDNLFSTHPNMENRVTELVQQAHTAGIQDMNQNSWAGGAAQTPSLPDAGIATGSGGRRGPWG
jgi:heat shock protein HtpX